MGSLDDAVNRRVEEQRVADKDVEAKRIAERSAASLAADEFGNQLRELANYLGRHTTPEKVSVSDRVTKWYKPSQKSPAGFCLTQTPYKRVLLPDGQLWESADGGRLVDLAKALKSTLHLGNYAFTSNGDGELHSYAGSGHIELRSYLGVTDAMAALAVSYLQDRHTK